MRAICVNPNTALALACACLLSGCAALASEAAVVGCQVADTVTTLRAVELGAREANPVVEWLLEKSGPGGFMAAKAGATALFLTVYPDVPSGLVMLLNGLTCAVAAHNARIVNKLDEKRGQDPFPGKGS
ncbi:MAG TPA: DUF5658 family protein [Burkholderiales bacterium]|nr:DUF5658 family protein [Burkholderiales bacterium]